MNEEKLLPDFLLAITITVVLFWFMVMLDDAPAAQVQYDPPCSLEYQLTIIEELRCAQPGQSDD